MNSKQSSDRRKSSQVHPVLDWSVVLESPRNSQQNDCCQRRPPKDDLVWVEVDCLSEGADESIQEGRNMDLDKRTRPTCQLLASNAEQRR